MKGSTIGGAWEIRLPNFFAVFVIFGLDVKRLNYIIDIFPKIGYNLFVNKRKQQRSSQNEKILHYFLDCRHYLCNSYS